MYRTNEIQQAKEFIHVLGISCLTNMACSIWDQALGYEEAIETADRVKSTFLKLISETIAKF